jgi:hypothetical protein
MLPLIAPILAQLVTVAVADRTEARYIVLDGAYAEVATAPRVGLDVGWKHSTLTFAYLPTLTLTPLEAKDPSLLVFQAGTLSVSHRWARTTVTASESGGGGKVNFRVQAFADPGTTPVTNVSGTTAGMPTMAPPTGTGTAIPVTGTTTPGGAATGTQPAAINSNPFRAFNQAVLFESSVSTLSVAQAVSEALLVNGELDYILTGAVDADARMYYPVVKGPRGLVSAVYRLTRQDSVTTGLTGQYAASNGNDAWLAFATETWTHQFDTRTSASLGAGISVTRNTQPDGLIYYDIYPNFVTGITHVSLLGRSLLSFGVNVASMPFVDPVFGTVDPRVTFGAFVGFTHDRFATTLTAASALSRAAGGNAESVNSLSASYAASYRVSDAFAVDGGLRAFWQSLNGLTTIPFNVAAYVGVTFGAQSRLNSGR